MATKLIELEKGILVEVEVDEKSATHIAGSLAKQVNKGLEAIEPVLISIASSLARAWEYVEMQTEIEQITAEVGVSFEGEGNVFITKAKTGANLVVTLTLKPKAKQNKE